jgi:pyruvate dehydrogenase E1 component beta subunit
MPIDILMPALSPTMEEGTLAKWLVKNEGDSVVRRRRDRRDRNRQGDDGSRGRRRGHRRQDPGRRGHRGREGQHRHRRAAGRRRRAPDIGNSSAEKPAHRRRPRPKRRSKAAAGPAAAARAPLPTPRRLRPGHSRRHRDGETTVREALRDAMAEEMRRDEDVFVMGEEVAEYQGAYKITQGLLDEFGAKRVIDTPITEHGFTGIGVGAAWRAAAHRRVHDLQLRHAGDRPDHQLGRQDALHVRRPDGRAHRVPRPQRRGGPRRRPAQPGLRRLVFPCSGPEGRQPYSAADAKGLLKTAIRDPNPVIFLENEILYGQTFDVPKLDDFVLPFGKARSAREGTDVTIVSFGIGMTYALEGGRQLAGDGHRGEVIDLRTCARWTCHGDRKRQEDQPLRGGRGRLARNGSIGTEIATQRAATGVRLSRCAGDQRSPARTCRCLMPPTSRSWRCRMLMKSSTPSKPSYTAKGGQHMPINITDARPVAHHGGGQPRQMAGQGRRQASPPAT